MQICQQQEADLELAGHQVPPAVALEVVASGSWPPPPVPPVVVDISPLAVGATNCQDTNAS